MLEGWQLTSIVQWQTGPPILLYDDTNDLSLTGEGNNASNERWNIQGDPRNLKSSAKGSIPFLDPVIRSVNQSQPLRLCRIRSHIQAAALPRTEPSSIRRLSGPSATWEEIFFADLAL